MKGNLKTECSKKQLFFRGVKNGIPIAMGYLSVSVSFGLLAVSLGLPVWFAVLLSMTNLTSAGQVSGVGMIAAGSTLPALAVTQFIINIRYSLMSVSLSQKAGKSMTLLHRVLSGFFITDEIFAAAYKEDEVEASYIYGLGAISFTGWTLGTLLGALFGSFLPEFLLKPLSAALYAMFIAIVVPESRKSRGTLAAVLCAVILHCLLRAVPVSELLGGGMTMILCAVAAAGGSGADFSAQAGEGGGRAMMTAAWLIKSCAVMALVTYFVRVVPLAIVKHKIQNRFVNSFLYYIPYTVLAAMVIPDIFSATAYFISAAAGFITALVTAYLGKSLFFVASASCTVIMALEVILRLINLPV